MQFFIVCGYYQVTMNFADSIIIIVFVFLFGIHSTISHTLLYIYIFSVLYSYDYQYQLFKIFNRNTCTVVECWWSTDTIQVFHVSPGNNILKYHSGNYFR